MIILQDAAAMFALHPERRTHTVFRLPIFADPEFLVRFLFVVVVVFVVANSFVAVDC